MIGVGDLVVCIKSTDSRLLLANERGVIAGTIYTVRDCLVFENPSIRLEEIHNPTNDYGQKWGRVECAFLITSFRPVRKSSIEIFRTIAANPKQPVKVLA